jgi:hypothetical protein
MEIQGECDIFSYKWEATVRNGREPNREWYVGKSLKKVLQEC